MIRRTAFLLAALCACAPAPPAAPAPPGRGPDAEERAVLAAVARELAGDAAFAVVADSTYGVAWSGDIRAGLVGFGELAPATVDELGRDYAARNGAPTAVPTDLGGTPIRTYSWRASTSAPRRHDAVLAQYAQVGRFHRISRPGIDPRRTTAVVWHAFWCRQGLCGFSGMLILRREPAGWRVVKEMPLTVV